MVEKVDKVNRRLLKLMDHVLPNNASNFDLDKVGRKLFGKKYAGTWPADKLPKLDSERPYCILNVDKSGLSGSHWIGCVYSKGDILVYDSFGRKSSKLMPDSFEGLKIRDTEYDVEQKIEELNCGARAMTAILIYNDYGRDIFLSL
jgi:hypothetical protein